MAHDLLPDRIELRVLLENLAGELQSLASTIIEIENSVGEAISEKSPSVGRISAQLQGMDHLAQIATEIADFMQGLSELVDGQVKVSASDHINSIRLRALADSLAGNSCKAPTKAETVGEVDFF